MPSCKSAVLASQCTALKSTTTAKGSATSAMGGQGSLRNTVCKRASSSSSPAVLGCRSSSSTSSKAPSALAPLSPSHEGEHLHHFLVNTDLVDWGR
jgi:hypothetical protein